MITASVATRGALRSAAEARVVVRRTRPAGTVTLFLLLLLTLPAFADTPADEVRAAETGFAKAFADRDVKRFSTYIAWDATFIVRGKPVRGRDEVVKSWGDLLGSPAPPFSWKQEQAYVDEAGKSAMSFGSIFDPEGNRVATFTSYWRKEADGWRVVFDGPGAPVCPKPK